MQKKKVHLQTLAVCLIVEKWKNFVYFCQCRPLKNFTNVYEPTRSSEYIKCFQLIRGQDWGSATVTLVKGPDSFVTYCNSDIILLIQ